MKTKQKENGENLEQGSRLANIIVGSIFYSEFTQYTFSISRGYSN